MVIHVEVVRAHLLPTPTAGWVQFWCRRRGRVHWYSAIGVHGPF